MGRLARHVIKSAVDRPRAINERVCDAGTNHQSHGSLSVASITGPPRPPVPSGNQSGPNGRRRDGAPGACRPSARDVGARPQLQQGATAPTPAAAREPSAYCSAMHPPRRRPAARAGAVVALLVALAATLPPACAEVPSPRGSTSAGPGAPALGARPPKRVIEVRLDAGGVGTVLADRTGDAAPAGLGPDQHQVPIDVRLASGQVLHTTGTTTDIRAELPAAPGSSSLTPTRVRPAHPVVELRLPTSVRPASSPCTTAGGPTARTGWPGALPLRATLARTPTSRRFPDTTSDRGPTGSTSSSSATASPPTSAACSRPRPPRRSTPSCRRRPTSPTATS